jgi:hypothetical protein
VPKTAAKSAPAPAKAADVRSLRYVAGQPIFDREQKVFGYELLFRDHMENMFHGGDADAASRSTLYSSLLVGLDVLCDDRHAFVNCTVKPWSAVWSPKPPSATACCAT